VVEEEVEVVEVEVVEVEVVEVEVVEVEVVEVEVVEVVEDVEVIIGRTVKFRVASESPKLAIAI